MKRTAVVLFATSIAVLAASAARAAGDVRLTWIPGTTVKVEQLTGDCDCTALAKTGQCTPTTSRTITRAKVVGTDIGASFESQGKLIFLFGDLSSIGALPGRKYVLRIDGSFHRRVEGANKAVAEEI